MGWWCNCPILEKICDAMSDMSNALVPANSLMGRLCMACAEEWSDFTLHPFVRGLADGSLPEAAFRHYLAQDYLFLIHFARAYGLAVYKSETIEDMRKAAGAISGILDIEMDLHVRYCADWGLTEVEMANVPEDPACMAYTRFVLERGTAGDTLDLHTALSPCAVGYGVIGKALAEDPMTKREGNPYLSWIEMYASPEYLDVVNGAVIQLDRLSASRGGEARFEALAKDFRVATLLECGFWQMGLDAPGSQGKG
jgi:thiaminase/transcriptional activator TenA